MTKGIVIKPRKETKITDEQIFALLRESYQQWMDSGLESPWRDFNGEDFERFRKFAQKATVFVALDAETGELLGTHSLRANRKAKKVNGSCLAVSPKAKRRGVATQMLRYEEERIRKAGYKCICENTAVDAEWSVNWHLRNGFRIIGFFHSEGNNYNSYAFRKQLVPSLIWENSLFCRCRYLISYLVTRFL